MFEIGTSLREARDRRRLSYDQVEAETKIRAKYIRCLEEEEFDALPSATYVKGFLRTYADYLGLDGQLYVDEYNSRYGDLHPDDQLFRRRERPAPRRRESSNAVLVGLAGIVAVAVLFFVAWRFGGSSPPRELPVPSVPAASPPENPATAKPKPPPKHRVRHRHRRVKARPVHAKPAPPAAVKLVVRAVGGASWLRIRRGQTGSQIYAGIVQDGQWIGGAKVRDGFTIFDVGQPSYLQLVVNGKTYTLAGSGPWYVGRRRHVGLVPAAASTGASGAATGTATTGTATVTTTATTG